MALSIEPLTTASYPGRKCDAKEYVNIVDSGVVIAFCLYMLNTESGPLGAWASALNHSDIAFFCGWRGWESCLC